MRALRYHAYGGIEQLALEQIPPPAPRGERVRVRVLRAALNPKDALFRKGRFRALSGRSFPKTPGLDFAGEVLDDPSGAHPTGTRVFGALDEWRCTRGTLADEVLVRGHELARLPDRVSFDDGAATALAGLTALQALRDLARIEPGQRVLVNGASGGVGTFAIQIARRYGAHVTTISSAANRAFCINLGADRALGYDLPSEPGAPFDVVFDVFGNLPAAKARPRLTPRGLWIGTVPTARGMALDLLSRALPLRERVVIVSPNTPDLDTLAGWLVDGTLRAEIDVRAPLAAFGEAFGRLESKRTRGKIVLAIDDTATCAPARQ